MVVYAGVDLYSQKLSFRNDNEEGVRYLKIDKNYTELDKRDKLDKNNDIMLFFKEIKSRLHPYNCDKFGCVCIYLPSDFGNEIRKTFVKEGLNCGFKNVQFLNKYTALYYGAMSANIETSVEDDVIWIKRFDKIHVFKVGDTIYIGNWHANHLNEYVLKNIVTESKLNRGPNIFLSDIYAFPENRIMQEISKKCELLIYNGDDALSIGCLFKSQISAVQLFFAPYNVVNCFGHKIVLKIREKEIVSFLPDHPLPIYYSQVLTQSNVLLLQVFYAFHIHEETFEITCYKDTYLTFEMDTNGIYSVNILDELKNKVCSAENAFVNDTQIFPHDPSIQPGTSYTNGANYVIPKKEILLKKDFPVIGIDLGTSRCCAAVNRNDGIATVPLDNTGERLLPSFVSYDEEKVKCGRVVMGRLRHYAKSTIFDSKRIIGRPFNDIEIDENWNFNVNFDDKEVYMEIRGVNNERKRITAETVASDLLRFIKVKAEEYQGKKNTNVVITVPAAFTEEQKASTMSAAKLAGWTNIHLLPEPMAAAFAYFLNRPIPDKSNVLLFDLGGGTLDVCIFKVEKDNIKIISNTGDSKLGGRNFDTVLINYFKNLLNSEHGITTLKDKKYKLMLECQRIKEDLTTLTNTSLDIDEFDPGKKGEIPISREGFQRMTQPLLNKAKITIQAALFNSNLKENQITQILHVGGGSRMPMIKQLLLDIFPDADHRSEEHPDEVVAIGAAFYAYSIFSD